MQGTLHADRAVRFAVGMTQLNAIQVARLLALLEMPAPAIRASLSASFPDVDARDLAQRATAERAAFEDELAHGLGACAA